MPVAQEADVRRTIPPEREAKIWRAMHRAWEDVAEDQPKYSIWPRSRANMMFERLAVRLQQEFADDPGVKFCFADETVKIDFDGLVLARCKKANERGLGQNVSTQANMIFCEAQEQLALFPGHQKIEIVYVVNRIGTELSDILVQARDGDMRLWAYPIDQPAAGGAGATIIPLPPTPPPPTSGPASDVSDLVQPRKKPANKEETDKSEK